ncbi:MAG: SGNH/GDSL hydrolase family protein [Candidatus Hydrogenedentota bacterium]
MNHWYASYAAIIVVMTVTLLGAGYATAQGETPGYSVIDPSTGTNEFGEEMLWYDAAELPIEGRGWTDVASTYDRLPARAEGVVRPPVWNLSHDSAGMAIHFMTDSPAIGARWVLRDNGLAMPHMPATGVSGMDLYVKQQARWIWVANGRPSAATMQTTLVSGIPEGMHEYLLYLPLYNGVTSVHIGIKPDAALAAPPERPEERRKPIVFWGTSILQGGCAARPGMAYPSIIGRMLDRPTINLGFSGNGQMEPEMAEFIAELDVEMFVVDCCPNLGPEEIAARTEPMVHILREARPETPIVLVENIIYQEGYFIPSMRESYEKKNAELKAAYDRLVESGVKNLHYIPCDNLLGDDVEATVDGTHATDVGFLRMAKEIAPVLSRILER